MAFESGRHYREYKLIQGINLLTNMVRQIKDERNTLKEIHKTWDTPGFLSFGDQMEFIWGTAADKATNYYLAYCINQLNSYMMSKYPRHRGLINNLATDILNAINLAVHANAHILTSVQLESIQAAFMSSRVAKATPFYELLDKQEEEKKKKRHIIGKNNDER